MARLGRGQPFKPLVYQRRYALFYVIPAGIDSEEAFGTPLILTYILPTGIDSQESFGIPALVDTQLVSPTGIDSVEDFGTPTFLFTDVIAPTGIASAESVGAPLVYVNRQQDLQPPPRTNIPPPLDPVLLGEQLKSPAQVAIEAADKLAAAELTAPTDLVCLFYDRVYKVRGECGDYISLQVAKPRHLVETGNLVMKGDDALALDALKCHEEVVPVTVEIGNFFWSGRVKIAHDRFGRGDEADTVVCELEGDRAWLTKIIAWPNFLLPIQVQFPNRGVAFGPAISVIRWLVAAQTFRIQAGLWDLLNNLGSLNLDWRSWFGTFLMADVLGPDGHFNLADILRVLRTPIYVVQTDIKNAIPGLLFDTSPFIAINWRMDKIADLIDQIVKDNGLVVEVALWRPGDPQPDENMAFPLTVPTIVVDVKDRTGIVGPTHTFLDGILHTLIDLQDSVFGEITQPFLNPANEPVPEGFNIAPILGLHWVPPWAIFMADHPQSGCWGQISHHHPLAWRTIIGGKSPKWMNDIINATMSWILDSIMIIIGLSGIPSTLLDGLFNDVLLAFQLADNMTRRIKLGPYGYPEAFAPTGHSPYNVDAIFALKREQWNNRGYVSAIVNFDNGYPYKVGKDLFVGSMASVVRRGKVYTDFVENIVVVDERDGTKVEVQIGDGIAEEHSSVKTYRNVTKALENINILMLSSQ